MNSEGWCLPPLLIVQGVYYLANWFSETNLPDNWVIKTTSNGWTNNETGLEWIRHFDEHTGLRTKGLYRMLVIDGHESHMSAKFDTFCKDHKIITISLPPHSSHLLQPLDVGCFNPLKTAYGKELRTFSNRTSLISPKLNSLLPSKPHIMPLSQRKISKGDPKDWVYFLLTQNLFYLN